MKKLVTSLIAFFCALLSANAYDFMSDGIAYNITSDKTVEVTSGSTKNSGNIIIPETVQNNNKQYYVTKIG